MGNKRMSSYITQLAKGASQGATDLALATREMYPHPQHMYLHPESEVPTEDAYGGMGQAGAGPRFDTR
jgi:hypothetical protein